jgi:hypothetical protein
MGPVLTREAFEGEIAETSLAEVLTRLGGEEATGILSLAQGRVRKKICFVDGEIRLVASNIKEEGLADRLLGEGLVDSETYGTLVDEPGEGPLGRRVVETTGLGEAKVASALTEQIRGAVGSCLAWVRGSYRFEPGRPDIGDEVGVGVAPEELIISVAREDALDDAEVEALLASRDVPLVAAAGSVRRVLLGLLPVESFIVGLADGERTVGDLIDSCPVGADEASRALFVVMRAGLVAPTKGASELEAPPPRPTAAPEVEAPAPPITEPAAAPPPVEASRPLVGPTQEEIENLLGRLEGGDLFEALGVEEGVSREEIETAYMNIARRFHPDHFREGPFAPFYGRLEQAFARATEAYQTLTDPTAREQYARDRMAGTSTKTDAGRIAEENYRRGRALLETGRRQDALQFLENAARLAPDTTLYQKELGLLQVQHPRMRDDAERNLRAVLEREPMDTIARVGLGLLLQRQGKRKEALREIEEALRWEPEDAAALAALGRSPVTPAVRRGPLGALFTDS